MKTLRQREMFSQNTPVEIPVTLEGLTISLSLLDSLSLSCPEGSHDLPHSLGLPLSLLPSGIPRPSVSVDLPLASGVPRSPSLFGSPSRSLALRDPPIPLSLWVSLTLSCLQGSHDLPLSSGLHLALLPSGVQRSPSLFGSPSRSLAFRGATIPLSLWVSLSLSCP